GDHRDPDLRRLRHARSHGQGRDQGGRRDPGHAGDLVRPGDQGRREGREFRPVLLRRRGQAGRRQGGWRGRGVPHCPNRWRRPAGRPTGGLQQAQVGQLLCDLRARQRPTPDRRQLPGTLRTGVRLPGLQRRGRQVKIRPAVSGADIYLALRGEVWNTEGNEAVTLANASLLAKLSLNEALELNDRLAQAISDALMTKWGLAD